MKQLFVASITVFALLIMPASVSRAAGPPQPSCIPEGTMCVNNYSGQYSDGSTTLTVYWSCDRNLGNIVSTSATDSNANNTCGPTYKPVNPNYSPNPGPITVYSQYVHTQNIIKIVFSSSGSYVGSSGTTTEQCI